MYPDSMPGNAFEILEGFHVPCLISPLHSPESDHLPDEPDEVSYKPHYHVVLAFDGQKPESTVSAMCGVLHGTRPFVIESINGYIRYLVHKDNPDKPQYHPEDITLLSGAEDNFHQAFEIGDFDVYKITDKMMQYIRDTGICEFVDLYDAACDRPGWTYVLNKYPCRSIHAILASMRYGR